ncbi:MAG: hypothetical protein IPN68_19920 [Bacteroidetes bacterium]|nr:hypothetical protein [Bacteroidota bacterium]
MFSAYIAIDPRMNWDQNKILNQGYSDTDSKKDNAAAFELAEFLDSNKKTNLRFSWKYYN